jgi:C1A family cysteine protease
MNYGPVLASIKWYDKCKFNGKIIEFDKTTEYGYHAIMVCGWNKDGWICQNSWGRTWNKDGTFVFPFSEDFREAWSFVDAQNDDIVVPMSNSWLNIIYKLINSIINLFKGEN